MAADKGTKICTKCDRELPAAPTHFYHHQTTADGFVSDCKECRGGSFGIHKPNHMDQASEGHKICVKCEEEYPETAKYFHRRGDGFKSRCKECRGGTFGIHDKNKTHEAKAGHKFCSKCDRELPADPDHFHRNPSTKDEFQSACKECKGYKFGVHRPNAADVADDGYRYCSGCDEQYLATAEHFYTRGDTDRLESYCKSCSAHRSNNLRRKYRELTHHTLTGKQWNKIKKKWGCDDGFRCAYCGRETDSPERDHVRPLSDGGPTEAENIVPACPSCNRSKGATPVTEWYPSSEMYDEARWSLIKQHADI